MKNRGCISFLLWLSLLFLALFSVIGGFAIYGPSVGVLAFGYSWHSERYRNWLKRQHGFQTWIRSLPGMSRESPKVLAFASLAYSIVASILSWMLIAPSITSPAEVEIIAYFGLVGLLIFFVYFVLGWTQDGSARPSQSAPSGNVGRRDHLRTIRALGKIRELDPLDFERYVGLLFQGMGYTVDVELPRFGGQLRTKTSRGKVVLLFEPGGRHIADR